MRGEPTPNAREKAIPDSNDAITTSVQQRDALEVMVENASNQVKLSC